MIKKIGIIFCLIMTVFCGYGMENETHYFKMLNLCGPQKICNSSLYYCDVVLSNNKRAGPKDLVLRNSRLWGVHFFVRDASGKLIRIDNNLNSQAFRCSIIARRSLNICIATVIGGLSVCGIYR